MKVLICVESLNVGGIETWLKNLVFVNQGVKFDFFVQHKNGYYEKEIKSKGCRVFHSKPQSIFDKLLQFVGLSTSSVHSSFRTILSKESFDVVHVNGTEFMGDFLKIANEYNVPKRIAHCHTTGINKFNSSIKMRMRGLRFVTIDRARLNKHATNLLSCSNESAAFFLGSEGAKKKLSTVIYCGVPTVSNFNNVERDTYGIPGNAKVIGHVGTFSEVKNHRFIVDLFSELLKTDRQYYLFLAGDGYLHEEIKLHCKKLGVFEQVIMPGHCKDIPSLMVSIFDMLILPSHYEGMPLVAVEAINVGLKVLCSDTITKDLTDYFSERIETASLNANHSLWTSKIHSCIDSKIEPEKGRAIVEASRFSINSSYDRLVQIYKS
ncbi:glycosyltransferase [Vibrio breoganii]